jgi:hypothetical protein
MSTPITVTGVEEAIRAMQQLERDLSVDSGPQQEALMGAAKLAARYATSITHRLTGTLGDAHTPTMEGSDAVVLIDPSARNPKTGQLAAFYGVFEHQRGGVHAFYDRTIDENGDRIIAEYEKAVDQIIDKAVQ